MTLADWLSFAGYASGPVLGVIAIFFGAYAIGKMDGKHK